MNQQNIVFPSRSISLANTTETVYVGGRDKFKLLPAAFGAVKTIGSIGWGSQGPAQAMNANETLEGTGIKLAVGLREGSSSFREAESAGFLRENGTLGEMYEVMSRSDLIVLLIKDAAQAEQFEKIQAAMRPGVTLLLCHGFLIGHMKNVGAKFREDINVVGVFPKGMGDSVRRLYGQGRDINGAGINASWTVYQDYTGTAANIALAWAITIGSPYAFWTTMDMERISDLVGERSDLLAAPWGMVEALYTYFAAEMSPHEAFIESALSLTGPISKTISKSGLLGVVEQVLPGNRGTFFGALNATYRPAKAIVTEIYDEVASGREVASVVSATARLEEYPFSKVQGSPMWQIGKVVRATKAVVAPLNPLTAGIFLGIIMAQVDVFSENGHAWNEIANESIIEAVDSLLPYMHARGIEAMVDGCSTTARLGTRKWGPRFQQTVTGDVLPRLAEFGNADSRWFLDHPVHQVLAECMTFRPPVDIAVA